MMGECLGGVLAGGGHFQENLVKSSSTERFQVTPTRLEGLLVVARRVIGDDRGWFERMFCVEELTRVLGNREICQVNHSRTSERGTVRGLHFQRAPHAEQKWVTCLSGEVFDVAVDLRVGSPTFGQWHGERLSSENARFLVIPEGFAHGFQTLRDDCEMLYFHTAAHCPEAEAGVHAQDSRLGVEWPLAMKGLSPRDQALPGLEVCHFSFSEGFATNDRRDGAQLSS